MTRQELRKRLDEIEHESFMRNMNDHLTAEDYQILRKLAEEHNRLTRELEAINGN